MRRKALCANTLFTLFIVLLDCQSVLSAGININWTNRGWYNELGTRSSISNYIVGDSRGSTCSPLVYCAYDFHNFFVFNLAGVTKPIASATLALKEANYFSPDPSETYELHNVTTSITSLVNGTGGVAAWNDLGSGVVYGSLVISDSDFNAIVEIPLNSAAIAAMNSNHGLFAMGGSLTTLDNLVNSEVVFATTNGGNETTQLRLTYVPEPSTLVLIGIGATSLLCYRKARSHRQSP